MLSLNLHPGTPSMLRGGSQRCTTVANTVHKHSLDTVSPKRKSTCLGQASNIEYTVKDGQSKSMGTDSVCALIQGRRDTGQKGSRPRASHHQSMRRQEERPAARRAPLVLFCNCNLLLLQEFTGSILRSFSIQSRTSAAPENRLSEGLQDGKSTCLRYKCSCHPA